MDSACNPAAATPESLHAMYVSRAAITGNPTVLRNLNTSSLKSVPLSNKRNVSLMTTNGDLRPHPQRMHGNLKVVSERSAPEANAARQLTFNLSSISVKSAQHTMR